MRLTLRQNIVASIQLSRESLFHWLIASECFVHSLNLPRKMVRKIDDTGRSQMVCGLTVGNVERPHRKHWEDPDTNQHRTAANDALVRCYMLFTNWQRIDRGVSAQSKVSCRTVSDICLRVCQPSDVAHCDLPTSVLLTSDFHHAALAIPVPSARTARSLKYDAVQ